MVIIDNGRVVLAGDLAELRAAIPRRYVDIRYRGPAPVWSGLANVEVIEATDGAARLRVEHDTDLVPLLAAARGTGELISFVCQPPTLSELFRQAVAA